MGVLLQEISSNFRQSTKKALQKLSHTALTKVSGSKDKALLWSYGQFKLSPYIILQGYLQGIFPLPNMKNGKIIEWYDPEIRGIIPIQDFKIQKDLLRQLKKEKLKEPSQRFEIRINTNFKETLIACSKPRGTKTKTWITPEYIEAATELHEMGLTHSVETYINGVLVGGVVGMAVNGSFGSFFKFVIYLCSSNGFLYLSKLNNSTATHCPIYIFASCSL